jgi:hypothetical protein
VKTLSDYVRVDLNTEAFFQAPFRSQGNGCLIGNGGPNAPQTFWLTRPTGSDYNLMTVGSDLKDSVDTWYGQRNAERVYCINTGSVNAASVVDETPRPSPDGTETTFFISSSPVISIDAVSIDIDGTVFDLPAGGYSFVASQDASSNFTGEIVISPPPPSGSRIFVDYSMDALQNALRLSMSQDVQILVLCNNTTLTDLQTLATHLDLAFASLRFRMGVSMLPKGQELTGSYRTWPRDLATENMMLVSHNSTEDAAAGYAGALSGIRVFDDPILLPVNLTYDATFTDNARLTFKDNKVICIDNYYTNELGLRALRNYTLSPTSDRQYVDFVRTYQDLMWRLIATLDSPLTIGKISYTRAGIAKLKSDIYAAFLIPISIGEIVDIVGIDIPLEQIIRKPFATRSAAEVTTLNAAKAARTMEDITVSYEAQSWVDDLRVTLQVA